MSDGKSDRKAYQLPALDPSEVPRTIPELGVNTYPEPFYSRMGEVEHRALGDACGLGKLGVNSVVLGKSSATIGVFRPTSQASISLRIPVT